MHLQVLRSETAKVSGNDRPHAASQCERQARGVRSALASGALAIWNQCGYQIEVKASESWWLQFSEQNLQDTEEGLEFKTLMTAS